MSDPRGLSTDDDLGALREAAELHRLIEALVRRGEDAIERGAWPDAQRDLDEAAHVAALAAQPALAAQVRLRAAFAYRADGQPDAAATRERQGSS
jgi:hypothetical protein